MSPTEKRRDSPTTQRPTNATSTAPALPLVDMTGASTCENPRSHEFGQLGSSHVAASSSSSSSSAANATTENNQGPNSSSSQMMDLSVLPTALVSGLGPNIQTVVYGVPLAFWHPEAPGSPSGGSDHASSSSASGSPCSPTNASTAGTTHSNNSNSSNGSGGNLSETASVVELGTAIQPPDAAGRPHHLRLNLSSHLTANNTISRRALLGAEEEERARMEKEAKSHFRIALVCMLVGTFLCPLCCLCNAQFLRSPHRKVRWLAKASVSVGCLYIWALVTIILLVANKVIH